jgi:pilus assembly protein CpaF
MTTAEVIERVRRRLASSGGRPDPVSVAALVRVESGGQFGDAELLELARLAQAELVGAGPLEPVLRDPRVTDVLVNGPDQVWADRGAGLELLPIRFEDGEAVRRLAQRLAATAGRRLDDAQPYVDAPLPDGSRLHAVLPPVAQDGTYVSLRTLRPAAFALADLCNLGTVTEDCAVLLKRVLDKRLSLLISGGTGSGKTTLLCALLGAMPAGERLIVVEDSPELRPQHPHVVRLAARPPNIEGAGEITLRDLIRQALRMRPDRLVVGEVRGAEVVDLLAALNTGHDGGAGTVHANSAAEVPARLEALAATGGLGRDALHSQLMAAARIVVHLRRERTGLRVVEEIAMLMSSGDRVTATAAWRRDGGRCPAGRDLADLLEAS